MAKAVVGDGGDWIGPLADLHFPGFTRVLDFLHLLVHLYAAATAVPAELSAETGSGRLHKRPCTRPNKWRTVLDASH